MCTYDMFYNDLGEVTQVIAIVTAIKRVLLTQKSPRDIPLCGDIRNRKLTYWRVESSTCRMNEAETLTAFFVGSNSSYFFFSHNETFSFSFTIFRSYFHHLLLYSQSMHIPVLSTETKIQIIKVNRQRLNDGAGADLKSTHLSFPLSFILSTL